MARRGATGPRILALFDIDGTLVDTRGAGVTGMSLAFREIYGWEDALQGVPIAGRTDRAILGDVFERRGVTEWSGAIESVRSAYLDRHLQNELLVRAGEPMVLPGVTRMLDRLTEDDRFVLGLLTGNFEGGARLKLAAARLWERFTLGAYGDEHVNRRDLVPVAAARAAAQGIVVEAMVVIGDTPLDVDCAQANGARALAVATGHYSVEDLRATGADLVVETLAALDDPAEQLAVLAGSLG